MEKVGTIIIDYDEWESGCLREGYCVIIEEVHGYVWCLQVSFARQHAPSRRIWDWDRDEKGDHALACQRNPCL